MAKKSDDTFDEITPEIRAAQPYAVEDYEPEFPRDSTTRRVLGFITDDEDAFAAIGPGTAPRNTPQALTIALMGDENTPGIPNDDMSEAAGLVADELELLVNAGFIVERDDGSYGLTDDGFVELSN
jgi:hypothetical protein